MSRHCCVPSCSNNKNSNVLYAFPNHPDALLTWCKLIGREDIYSSMQQSSMEHLRKWYRICDVHFATGDKITIKTRKTLKDNALPRFHLNNQTESVSSNGVENGTESQEIQSRKAKQGWKKRFSQMGASLSFSKETISTSLQRLMNAKENEEYVRFDEICRTCLTSKNEMIEIKDVTFGDMTAREVLQIYISVTMEEEDDLPQKLCAKCLYELCRVYLFVNNCREADTKLKEIATEHKSAEEEIVGAMQEPILIENPTDPEALMNMGPLKVDEPGPPFVCNNCKETFDTLTEIKNHRRQNKHYIVQQYLCRFCDPSKVYSFVHWKSHMVTHTGLKPYECKVCGKKFSTHANRARHILIHTGEKPYSCSICLKAFTQKTQLTAHHLKTHDPDKLKQFQCGKCGKVLSTKAGLVHHQVSHAEKKLLCTECGKSFHYQMQFNMHMDTHRGIQRYKCPVCDKKFARPMSLALHKRTHTGQKPYRCNFCDKTFAQRGHLMCHSRIHTGERPYECPYCGKTFASNGNMTVHIRKHTGENPYVCDVCQKGFADASSRNKHRRKHHVKIENPPVGVVNVPTQCICDICNKDFPDLPSMNEHRNEEHIKLESVNSIDIEEEVINVPIQYHEVRSMPIIFQ